MQVKYAGVCVEMEPKDYFYIKFDRDGTYEINLNGKNHHPLKFRHVTRQQLKNLCTQVNKLTLSEQEYAIEQKLETENSMEKFMTEYLT